MSEPRELGWLRAAGAPRALGRALGRAGRAAVETHLMRSAIWARVTDPAHAPRVARMRAAVAALFPWAMEEIEGLAEGLGLPLMQVMAWNCRGDLLASVPDGCTTVMLPGETPMLAHNEDGLPFFRGACFIAELAPEGAPGLRAFCYPGSIPGHTFAFTDAGLAQTVNNLRLTGVEAEVPRMVLGRAVLAAETLEAAAALLRDAPASGGFHFALSHVRDRRILSVEFGGGEVSLREVTRPEAHANHALHQRRGLAAQIVTRSSRDRQVRADALLAGGAAPLAVLRDAGGAGLPIRREAHDDPDDENTLATVVLRVTDRGIDWSIHDRTESPAYQGAA